MHLVIIKQIESQDSKPDLGSDISLWNMIVCDEHITELTRVTILEKCTVYLTWPGLQQKQTYMALSSRYLQ